MCALSLGLFQIDPAPVRATEDATPASVLEGDWIRVLDGCADLPVDQVLKLPENGGGNRVSRAEILSFRGGSFRARIRPAPSCQADFKPTGPDIKVPLAECSGGEATGQVTVSNEHHLTLTASRNTGTNNWGAAIRNFDFDIYNDQVLFLHGGEPINFCPDANQRIYFIRSPGT